MSEVTVKQFAQSVGTPVDRLLKQLQAAGLPHKDADAAISAGEKQTLLEHLQESHGSSDSGPKKVTLNRKKISTLKTGQRKAGRSVNVTVEVRRKKTYIRRGDLPDGASQTATATRAPSQSQIEAQRIREEELARKTAQEETQRQAAERKADEERRKEEARLAEETGKIEAAEALKAQEQAKLKAEEPARKEKDQAVIDPGVVAAEVQAQEQAAEKGGKRAKGIAHGDRKQSDDDFGDGKTRRRPKLSMGGSGRPHRRRKTAHIHVEQHGGEFNRPTDSIEREVEVPDMITVGDLAQRMTIKAGEVIKTLMGMGVMATINQALDRDTATLVVEEMGHKPKAVHEDAIEKDLEEYGKVDGVALPRSPVVTVMGHVDHGKTSLLDYIRKTRVASGEAGGITQHIGAYRVATKHGQISFIDTPGHAAFTAMRARGAKVTDIVILVVAADDGVMPQTEEAIQHAKAAGVPIVVAINKMDLEGADADRVTNELAAKDVVPEDWGGDTQFLKVSAVTGEGIDDLLEAITLQAEILELKAVKDAPGRGVVIESRLDRGRGPVATVLVQHGTLKKGDVLIAGEFYGKVRALLNENGEQEKEAGPSEPVELLGLNGTPSAGDDFSVVADERTARELAEFRKDKSQESRIAMQQAAKLDNMFAHLGKGEKRVLKMVLKTDVRGSLEAISQALAEIGNDEVSANILASGVGGITESDVTMAITYGAVVFGFNVRADNAAKAIIEREGIELRYYSVIYELLDDVKQVLSGMLAPELREEIVGVAEVRDVFRSPRFGQIAGCMVIEGTMFRNKLIRVLRDNTVIYQGELESLRRFKEDVNEVRNGTECGIGVRNYNDVHSGDLIEVYDTKEVAREL